MKHIKTIMDLLFIIEEMHQYLDGQIQFAETGAPIFVKEHFLTEWPELVIPFQHRKSNLVSDKKKTAICFFMEDARIYPRFSKILEELDIYKEFLGVIGPDITITNDMDPQMQDAILLANQLFMAVLAVNGIKIVLNTRAGNRPARLAFSSIPKGIMCASGFFGCPKSKNISEALRYTDKILTLFPSGIIIYGKRDSLIEEQLNQLGIQYRYYKDFHTLRQRRAS